MASNLKPIKHSPQFPNNIYNISTIDLLQLLAKTTPENIIIIKHQKIRKMH